MKICRLGGITLTCKKKNQRKKTLAAPKATGALSPSHPEHGAVQTHPGLDTIAKSSSVAPSRLPYFPLS